MTPSEEFADVFVNFSLSEMEKQMDLLIEIALITNNCNFDDFEERSTLFFFKQNIMRCLEAGNILAKKQQKRIGRKTLQAMEGTK
jgi:hypothetical protein